MKKCKRCHKEISGYDYKYCPYCGKKIEHLPEYPCNMCENARYITITTDEGEKIPHSEFYCKYEKSIKYDSLLYIDHECEGFTIKICEDCKKEPVKPIMHNGLCYKRYCKKCFEKDIGQKNNENSR